MMVIAELALGLITNLLSDTAKGTLGKLYTPSVKAYNNAVKELNEKFRLSDGEIDSFLHQENVKTSIKEYLENPNNQGILESITDEYLSSLNKDIFFKTRAGSILSDFFEILYTEIKKDPELRSHYELYLNEQINQIVQENNKVSKKISDDINKLHNEIKDTNNPQDTTLVYAKNICDRFSMFENLTCYIDLKCNDDSKDTVLIDNYVEKWLNEKDYPILAILGDFGTGKTTYATNLIRQFADRYINDNDFYLPILVQLKKFTNFWNLEDLIKNYDITYGLSIEDFKEKLLNGKILFVFDGYDELPRGTIEKFNEVNSLVADRNKVIITSRTHYFKYREDEKLSLNPESIDFTGISLKDEYKVKIVYIDLFTEDDIKKYLEKKFGANWCARYETINRIYNLSDLSKRPILLNLIVQTLSDLSLTTGDITQSKLYDKYINKWMSREKRKDVDPKYVSVVMEELAFKMFAEGKNVITIDELHEIIDRMFRTDIIKGKVDIEDINKKIRTASFIYRDFEDNFMFMHKSFMEFFIAKKFSQEINKGVVDCDSLGKREITPAIINFIKEMVNNKSNLLSIIEHTRGKTEKETGFLGGNAITLLKYLNHDFRQSDFSSMVLSDADLSNCDLSDTCFRKSAMKKVNLSNSILKFADFSETDLNGVIFEKTSKFNCFVWSPNGKYFATAGDDNIVRIWDASSYRQIKIFHTQDSPKCLSWSKESSLLACGNSNGSLNIWNVEDGKLYTSINFQHDSISSIALCKDRLIYGDWGGNIVDYDLKQTEEPKRIKRNGKINKLVSVDSLGCIFVSSGNGLEILNFDNLGIISLICKNETPFWVNEKEEKVIYVEADPIPPDNYEEEHYFIKLYSRQISSLKVEKLYSWYCSLDKTLLSCGEDDYINNKEYAVIDICGNPLSSDYSLIVNSHYCKYDSELIDGYYTEIYYDLLFMIENKVVREVPIFQNETVTWQSYEERIRKQHSYSNMCYSPNGSRIAYLDSGIIMIINADQSKDSFGESVKVIDRSINCEGIKIDNAIGLHKKQIRYIQENSKQTIQDQANI